MGGYKWFEDQVLKEEEDILISSPVTGADIVLVHSCISINVCLVYKV